MNSEDNILLIDKELTWTSFDVVAKARGITKIKKIGHAGTLDPLATGLLILATGKKTKTISQIQDGEKEYIMTFCLGVSTESLDTEFAPQGFTDMSSVTCEQIKKNITTKFIGEIQQIPPKFSAIKIKGKRAYNLARAGKDVDIPSRAVSIKEFELLDCDLVEISEVKKLHKQNNPDCDLSLVNFNGKLVLGSARVVCSKGTYIRTLADDLGVSLGASGYLLSLRRTRIGSYHVNDAVKISNLELL